ncbi:MAG: lipB [Candidatus Midichloriaceae bacterium]|jgi:lipoyl(octanoyl) transferase|nr:lipB [Candidatus Midichloriaceae bacterium]
MSDKCEIYISKEPVEYTCSEQKMPEIVKCIHQDNSLGKAWFLEHPHVYTAGVSAKVEELLNAKGVPVHQVSRGGKYTYHGPGQRVIYTMFNLKKLHGDKPDIRLFINQLEDWVIDSLSKISVDAYKVPNRVGIWVKHKGQEQKIAAIGIKLHKWVSYHGIAININPDLSYFQGIVPCGLADFGVCSLKSLGINISLEEFDSILLDNFYSIFKVEMDLLNEQIS